MIGDWVEVSNTALQIAALGTIKAGFADSKNELFYHYYDVLQPIPLTIEILLKNGYKETAEGVSTHYWIDDYDDPVMVLYSLDKFYLEYIEWTHIELKYVHELQHALRLCGIEKEIKL